MKTLYLSILTGSGIIAVSVLLFQIALEAPVNPHMATAPTPACTTLLKLERWMLENQIDKHQAYLLAKNDPEFLAKTKGFTIESQEIGDSISYNARHCTNLKLNYVLVAFLVRNGPDTHEVVVLENVTSYKIEGIEDQDYVGRYGFFGSGNSNYGL
ncbi:hypothetical protein DYY67_1780 [Candidatus Nitrosotalea sp. TS]|uniref:hypothetical protein n=1 Tax=Candidatus Nitrosotalea sp. TS TaxID=2341020 RepID=UPI001408C7CF|nr:hypothetical protein [Candidatus Nitrosotalea sp. TS]NHI04619.1 hypothetical protein [Candidatus Nitrosotalea sp. TS]